MSRALFSAALAVALVVRTACLGDPLWLDEVWSLALARGLGSPLEVLTRVHLDNNHHLSTLWLWLCGQHAAAFVYRLPALAAGFGTVLLAARFARRWGEAEARFALVLTGASYPLIVYASEARGYAPAGFFALAALLALDRCLATRGLGALAAFWLSVVLGMLSHLLFVQLWVAAIVWSVLRAAREGRGPRGVAAVLLRCHLVPALALGALYVLDLRHLRVGGGPDYSLGAVLLDAAAVAVGVDEGSAYAWAAAAVAAAAALAGTAVVGRRDPALAASLATGMVLLPGLALLVARPEVLFVRYFYLPILLFLLLAAAGLGRLSRVPRFGVPVAAALALAFVAVDAAAVADLLRFGRGNPVAVLRELAARSKEPIAHVGSDHDFRCGMVVDFYAPRIETARRIRYHAADEWPAGGPEWLIVTDQAKMPPPPRITSVERRHYDLVLFAPSIALSGMAWALYQKRAGQ